jgi:hypothetical protein
MFGCVGGDGMRGCLLWLSALVTLTSCSAKEKDSDPAQNLVDFVDAHKTGGDVDHWIEMKNLSGEWEKTVLVFGYLGDYDECQKVLSGLKKANFAREYRCVPANQK